MATIQGIYLALFGRPADPAGLAFFNGVTNNGTNLAAISNLSAQPEYLTRFSGMTNTQIVNSIYQSLFGRDAETAGLDFYVGQLTSGRLSINTIAINILDGAAGNDKLVVDAKIAAADLFTSHLDLAAEVTAYNGTTAAELARTYISSINTTKIGTTADVDALIQTLLTSGGQAPGGDGGGGGPSDPGGPTLEARAAEIKASWVTLDLAYGQQGANVPEINEAFTRLGVDYIEYLKDGGLPIEDRAKGDGVGRDQTFHDNLLGNVTTAALAQRYGATPDLLAELTALVQAADAKFLDRPYEDGSPPTKFSDADAWDLLHAVDRPQLEVRIAAITFVEANAAVDHKFEPNLDLTPLVVPLVASGNVADAFEKIAGLTSEASAFKILWDYVDDNFQYYNTSINEVGVRLGLAYFEYLKAGGEPLTDVFAKADGQGRLQSMHDNLLGNIHEASIRDKFFDSTQGGSNGGVNGTADNALGQELLTAVSDADADGRPYYGGNAAENADGGSYDKARAWDYEHSLPRTDYVERNADSKVDDSAIANSGYLHFGNGNLATGFNIVRDAGVGIEIALKAKERGGADYDGVLDPDGVAVYHVAGGNDTSHMGNGVRADWNFDFSVATGVNGNGKTLTDYSFKAFIDIDKSAGIQWVEFDMQKQLGAGNTPWYLIKDGQVVGGFADEDGSNIRFSQNSVNFGFDFLRTLIDNDPSTATIDPYLFNGGEFDIKFQASDASGVLVENQIRVIVDIV